MRIAAVVIAVAVSAQIAVAEPAPLRVAAASDLARVLERLGAEWKRTTGQEVRVSLGATTLLGRQITEGAPFDVFFAADEATADAVIAAGRCDKQSRVIYARGQLVLWSPTGAPPSLSALAEPRWTRIAVANPAHAPYGRAAEATLRKAGLWDTLHARLVIAENVLGALQFAKSGNVAVAFVARSLVEDDAAHSLVIDESLHPPILQAGVACGAAHRGRAFLTFIADHLKR